MTLDDYTARLLGPDSRLVAGDTITFEGVPKRPNIILRLLIWLGWKSPPKPPPLRQFVVVIGSYGDQLFPEGPF
jgi:hypothetical protein